MQWWAAKLTATGQQLVVESSRLSALQTQLVQSVVALDTSNEKETLDDFH